MWTFAAAMPVTPDWFAACRDISHGSQQDGREPIVRLSGSARNLAIRTMAQRFQRAYRGDSASVQ
jgi:hypothetical protein